MNRSKFSKFFINLLILSAIVFSFSTQPLLAHDQKYHLKPSEVEEVENNSPETNELEKHSPETNEVKDNSLETNKVEEDNHKNAPNSHSTIENSPTESIENSINSKPKKFNFIIQPSEFLFLLLIINPFFLNLIKKKYYNII